MYDPGMPPTEVYDITTSGIEPKNRFRVSKHDLLAILEYKRAIRNGWIKVDRQGNILQPKKKEPKVEFVFLCFFFVCL